MTMTEIDPDDGAKVERFEMVEPFIERLSEVDDFLSGRFLFRGVADAKLTLLPSARRESTPFGPKVSTEREHRQRELAALKRFYEGAYFEGLTIPSWPEVQAYVAGDDDQHVNVREFIALAQHYGTPTRLLDWTLDPLVAAYFAASDIKREHEAAEKMVVWRFDPSFTKAPGLSQPWTVIRIPFDGNDNARAQRAAFVEYPMSLGPDVARETLIEILKERDAAHGGPSFIDALLKFTLPRTKASGVLRALRVRRISASTLFPGYGGAAREERERCQIGDV